MDSRNLNIDLEELFRRKLENAELDPGGEVRQNLIRKLGRREFTRFNPYRFNVYYLGGAVIAGITALLLVTSDPGNKSEVNDGTSRELVISPDNGNNKTENSQKTDPEQNGTGIITLQNISETPITREAGVINEKETASIADPGAAEVSLKEKDDTLRKTGIRNEILPNGNVSGVSIRKKPVAGFDISSAAGCLPLKVKLLNRSVSFDSCLWTFGDGNQSKARDTEHIYKGAGEYNITLRVYGKEGSESVHTRMVTVYPEPVARFEILPVKPILPDDEIHFLNYSVDAVKSSWDFGDGRISETFEPVHKYSRYGNFNVRLVVWSSHGCTDTLVVMNAFSVSGCYIDFPNAFIPNADGPGGGSYSYKSDESAQIFHPVTSGVSDYQLRIFSKIGILIFETNDINTGWDGYHKGQLCESGVYIWKVRGKYKNGEPYEKMGDVTLLKK